MFSTAKRLRLEAHQGCFNPGIKGNKEINRNAVASKGLPRGSRYKDSEIIHLKLSYAFLRHVVATALRLIDPFPNYPRVEATLMGCEA